MILNTAQPKKKKEKRKEKRGCLDINSQMLKSQWLDHYCSDYYVSSTLYVWQQFF